jgi:hypothetical protein
VKLKLVVCLTTLLLLLSGCRGGLYPPDTAPASSAHPPATASPGAAVSAPPATALPEQSAPPPSGSGASPSASPQPSGDDASQQDVDTALNEILSELSALDQLFSEMDNIKDSDFN